MPDDTAARYVIGLGLGDALRHVAPQLPPTRYAELSARYREHYLARDPDIPLFAGARELVAELDAAGYLLGIATGKTRIGLDRALAQQALAHHFVATRCADEGFPKPNPDMLLHLMDRVGAGPGETLMIGDTTHDLDLARNAGVAAVAVAYGAHDHRGAGGARAARDRPLGARNSRAGSRGTDDAAYSPAADRAGPARATDTFLSSPDCGPTAPSP